MREESQTTVFSWTRGVYPSRSTSTSSKKPTANTIISPGMHGTNDLKIGVKAPPVRGFLTDQTRARDQMAIHVRLVDVGPPQRQDAILHHALSPAI